MTDLRNNFNEKIPTGSTRGEPQRPQGTIFLQDITKLDCALFDPAQGIIGQSWHVDLELTGQLDEQGLVYDFGPLKNLVRSVLKTNVDHALVIPIQSKGVEYQDTAQGECWNLTSKNAKESESLKWSYTCPKGAVYPMRTVALDRGLITQEITRSLGHRLGPEVSNVKLTLRDEEVDPTEAVFRYTHGISTHSGLCQRLFHGHRSCIEVYVSGERRPDLEHYVVWEVFGTNIHITAPRQLKSSGLEIGRRHDSTEPVVLAYESDHGYYEATLPANRVFVVEQETSIENITREVARVVRRRIGADGSLRVVCYEGIDKGAIAEA